MNTGMQHQPTQRQTKKRKNKQYPYLLFLGHAFSSSKCSYKVMPGIISGQTVIPLR
jgi:hypothetical protein